MQGLRDLLYHRKARKWTKKAAAVVGAAVVAAVVVAAAVVACRLERLNTMDWLWA